jgi:hypothetical protein
VAINDFVILVEKACNDIQVKAGLSRDCALLRDEELELEMQGNQIENLL